MMISRINGKIYSGPLSNYHYPTDKEFGELLSFLKNIRKNKKRVYLTDFIFWDTPYPEYGYDIYIFCSFGECVNEVFLEKVNLDPNFADKMLVLITSQYYNGSSLCNFKVFYLEHIHHLVKFFPMNSYKAIEERSNDHSILCRRIDSHKVLFITKLLDKFGRDCNYTFPNVSNKDQMLGWIIESSKINLNYDFDDKEIKQIETLLSKSREMPGHQWSVMNFLFQDTKVNWVNESVFISKDEGFSGYITEKSIKPIVSGCAFILLSQKHSYMRIKSLGFDVFDKEFNLDLQFDSQGDLERIRYLINIIDHFSINNKNIQDIVDYNYFYFYNEFYKKTVEKNLYFEENIISYINDNI